MKEGKEGKSLTQEDIDAFVCPACKATECEVEEAVVPILAKNKTGLNMAVDILRCTECGGVEVWAKMKDGKVVEVERERQLTFSAFQEITKTTAIYLESCKRANLPPWTYSLLGLADEAGEVLGKVKKMIRDNDGVLTPEIRESIKDELGDVQYYLARVAADFDIPLSDVAVRNIEKLADRKERGVLEGSGDNR